MCLSCANIDNVVSCICRVPVCIVVFPECMSACLCDEYGISCVKKSLIGYIDILQFKKVCTLQAYSIWILMSVSACLSPKNTHFILKITSKTYYCIQEILFLKANTLQFIFAKVTTESKMLYSSYQLAGVIFVCSKLWCILPFIKETKML